jgi:NADH-quinone oxidoreductase subunit M
MDQLGLSFLEKAGVFFAWACNPITQLLLIPLLGCLFISLTRPRNLRAIRIIAVTATALNALISIVMLTGLPAAMRQLPLFAQYLPFQARPDAMQFALPYEQYSWLTIKFGESQSFSVNYNVGVDGLSMPLIVMSTMVLLLCAIWSLQRTERIREYYAWFMVLQVGLLGVFVALDFVLFYLFWELMLVPMFFLIAGWGPNRARADRAAMKFFIYTMAGSVFFLIAFIAMRIFATTYSFSIMEIAYASVSQSMHYLPYGVRLLLFLGLFAAFAVKVPIFPFHTWLPDAHTEAPTEMSVVLAAIMLKTGAYGMMRILYPAMPDVAYTLGPILAAAGVIAIVYGGLITLVQTDFKRMVAYSSISHMGFIVLGISAMNVDASVGAVFHMVGHGIIIATLFFLSGVIEQRYGTRDIRELSGMLAVAPPYAVVLAIAAFAAMGFPLAAGFWGEFLILKGTFFNNPTWEQIKVGPIDGSTFLQWMAVLAVVGILISAVYMIRMLLKVLPGLPGRGEAGVEAAALSATVPAAVETTTGESLEAEARAPIRTSRTAVLAEPVPATDGGFMRPWRAMKLNEALALVPLSSAMVLLFFFPMGIINACNPLMAYLYMVYLSV